MLKEQNDDTNYSEEIILSRKEIRKKYLVNKLNYINFLDGFVLIDFKHLAYDHCISIKASPQPCFGEELLCLWQPYELDKLRDLKLYMFDKISIINEKNVIVVKPPDFHMNEKGIRVLLPQTCLEIESRRMRRFTCTGVEIKLIQNSVCFEGKLLDFNPVSFHIKIFEKNYASLLWVDPEVEVMLLISDNRHMLYAGNCKIIDHLSDMKTGDIILKPVKQKVRRYKPKDYRAERQRLVPAPYMSFSHPFTHEYTNLKVIDISGSGFSLEEAFDGAVLVPGMVIPEVQISFADSLNLICMVQILYRNMINDEKGGDTVRCGAAILHMCIEDHGKLLALLWQAKNTNDFLGNTVYMNDLWRFFFDSGFIYPEKYAFIASKKEAIKEIYEKVYNKSQRLFRHFLYQEKGEILGHMAIIRLYAKSWMIHHYAANSRISIKAGLDVLNQIGRFINESNNISTINMNYVFCYFRPENKFPNRVFGGISEKIANKRACSLDSFLYLHYRKSADDQTDFQPEWRLEKTRPSDYEELALYYQNISDGLMLHAFELDHMNAERDQTADDYEQLGFKREKRVLALRKDNVLKAVVLVNVSDVGLNLSELANCISLFILDESEVAPDILASLLSGVSRYYETETIPVLLLPTGYASAWNLEYEKIYNLWILNVNYSDSYFRNLHRLFRRVNAVEK
ncbi:MAG: hypothetical protein R6U50_16045 [Desulfobacterales bacterium]